MVEMRFKPVPERPSQPASRLKPPRPKRPASGRHSAGAHAVNSIECTDAGSPVVVPNSPTVGATCPRARAQETRCSGLAALLLDLTAGLPLALPRFC